MHSGTLRVPTTPLFRTRKLPATSSGELLHYVERAFTPIETVNTAWNYGHLKLEAANDGKSRSALIPQQFLQKKTDTFPDYLGDFANMIEVEKHKGM